MKFSVFVALLSIFTGFLLQVLPISDASLTLEERTTEKLKQNTSFSKTPTYTGITAKVDEIAQQITVLINSQKNGNGSGIIVAQNGQTYYVLTADHVVKNPDVYEIVTPNGKKYRFDDGTVKKFEGVDLALLSFISSESYQVATLADYYIGINDKPLVFLSGFPGVRSHNTSNPTRILTAGTTVSQMITMFAAQNVYSLANGYEMAYTNLSQRGMSGGPVLDHYGRVIGINTGVDAEVVFDDAGQESEMNLGLSLGVPIHTFLGLSAKAGVNSDLLNVETNIPPALSQAEIATIQENLLPKQMPSQESNEIEWLNWGNQLWRLRKFSEAVDAFDRAIELKPDLYQAYYAKGLALDSQKKYLEAAAIYEKVTQLQPNFYEAWRDRAMALDYTQNYSEALKSIDRAIEIQKDDAVLHIRRGQILQDLKRYADMRDALTKAIALKPSAFAYGMRALSQFFLKNYPTAIADSSKAIELQPNNYWGYNIRGTVYNILGNQQAALADQNKAIEFFPTSEREKFAAYLSRGTIRFTTGDTQGAISDYTEIIQGNAEETVLAQAYIGRAMTYAQLQDLPKAIADCTQLIALQPKNILGYYHRGSFYAQLQNYQSAIDDMTKAIEIEPDYADAYRYRGVMRLQIKDTQGAIADSQKAVALYTQKIASDNKNVELYIYRASARIITGDKSGASADVQTAELLFREQGIASGPYYDTFENIKKLLADFLE
jgi:tetratricopeptide (TPR) repeat protein